MYTNTNYKTKKALIEAVKAGKPCGVFQPNNMFNDRIPTDGNITLEGPHYPQPHKWYARATIKDGLIIKVS